MPVLDFFRESQKNVFAYVSNTLYIIIGKERNTTRLKMIKYPFSAKNRFFYVK